MSCKTWVKVLFTVSLLMSSAAHAESGAASVADCPDTAGFKIIGELEHVTLIANELRLQARIDTGAQTSSLGIDSQLAFERDGKKWLRFSIKHADSEMPIEFERPVVRTATVKRHGAEAMERPVVKMKVRLGSIELLREFTLADRSTYKFPVLIGRNVLLGKYLVDVNRKFTTLAKGEREQ